MINEISINNPLNLILLIIIFGFATYRIAKVITSDRIFDGIRDSIFLKIAQKKDGNWHTGIREKIGYMLGCDLCFGIWIALIFTIILSQIALFDNIFTLFIFWASVSGFQYKLTSMR